MAEITLEQAEQLVASLSQVLPWWMSLSWLGPTHVVAGLCLAYALLADDARRGAIALAACSMFIFVAWSPRLSGLSPNAAALAADAAPLGALFGIDSPTTWTGLARMEDQLKREISSVRRINAQLRLLTHEHSALSLADIAVLADRDRKLRVQSSCR